MTRTIRSWLLPVVLLCALPAPGQVVIQDGTPGLYGTPYVYLGWRDAKLWENYVKDDSQHTPSLTVPFLLSGVLSNPVTYQEVRTGYTDGTNYSFSAPGLFVGRVQATQSYPEASWSVLAPQGEASPRYVEIRVGFGEHLAAGGGASFGTMIANNGGGGAGSPMDLYQGNWGVDGVEMHLILQPTAANWELEARNCYLVAPTSPNEIGRTDHMGDSTVTGGTQVSPGVYDTGIPSTGPLAFQWRLDQTGGNTQLIVQLDTVVTVAWLFDDGLSRHGLTDPGNPGGEPFQNGSLDPASFIPVLFVGISENSGDNTSLAPIQVPIAQSTSGPVLAGLPATVAAGAEAPMTVSWVDDQGQVDAANQGTVHFESSDATAVLPADYTFTAADSGMHTFQAELGTTGTNAITVSRVSLPLLRSSLTTQVTAAETVTPVEPAGPHRRGPFDVGFNCSTTRGAPGNAWLLALLVAGTAVARLRRG